MQISVGSLQFTWGQPARLCAGIENGGKSVLEGVLYSEGEGGARRRSAGSISRRRCWR